MEGKVEGRKKVTKRRGRRCKELLNELKEKKDTGEFGIERKVEGRK
jgi:hypothetical protein